MVLFFRTINYKCNSMPFFNEEEKTSFGTYSDPRGSRTPTHTRQKILNTSPAATYYSRRTPKLSRKAVYRKSTRWIDEAVPEEQNPIQELPNQKDIVLPQLDPVSSTALTPRNHIENRSVSPRFHKGLRSHTDRLFYRSGFLFYIKIYYYFF